MPFATLRHRAALMLCVPLCFAFGECGRSQPLQCASNQDCPETQRCGANRHCLPRVAECATDRECGIYYRCENFDCVPLDGCRDDFDCDSPKRCTRQAPQDSHGTCERINQCPQSCPAHHFCGADLRCIPDGACGSDQDCATLHQCDHGQCRVLSCEQDNDCVAPRRCKSSMGQLVCLLPERCTFDQDCSGAQLCQEKICVDPVSQCDHCPTPGVCVQSRCLTPAQISTP